MSSTTSNQQHRKIFIIPLVAILIYGVAIAFTIFYLASKNDTTLLGDPYYEDKILAYQRALVPWLFTIANVALSLLIACGMMLLRRQKRRSDT